MNTSPLLTLTGAVAGNGIDAGVAAHYGSFNHEQRTLESGEGFVDLSHRDVLRVAGPDPGQQVGEVGGHSTPQRGKTGRRLSPIRTAREGGIT